METGKVSGRYRALARSTLRIAFQRGGGRGGAVRGERGPLSFNDGGGGGGVLSGGVMVQKTIIFLYAHPPEPASPSSVFLPSSFSFFIWLQQGVQLAIQRERVTVQCGNLDSNAQPSPAPLHSHGRHLSKLPSMQPEPHGSINRHAGSPPRPAPVARSLVADYVVGGTFLASPPSSVFRLPFLPGNFGQETGTKIHKEGTKLKDPNH